MMEVARQAIVAHIATAFAAAFPTTPVVFDNDPFDWDSAPAQLVEVEVKFYDGAQVNIAADPKTRLRGFVYVTVHARRGTGTMKAQLDWFIDRLKYQTLGPVQLQEPRPDSGDDGKVSGWYTDAVKFPFHTKPA